MNLRDDCGKLVGSVDTAGERSVAKDSSGRIVGTYDSRDNATRDASGHIITHGNSVESLVWKGQK